MAFPKHIVLGITGSISAYKGPELVRALVKAGASVQVILSNGGSDFTTPLSLATVSGKPILNSFYDETDGSWNNHVQLAAEADLLLVAPMSANTLSGFATGRCSSLLDACFLSAKSPVILCPAMDHDMWHHPATQRNIAQVKNDGADVMPPEHGELASGLIGDGRLPEILNIVDFIAKKFS